jgi:hypothetical protein
MGKVSFMKGAENLRRAEGLDDSGGGDNFDGMEARVARLESDMAYVQRDIAEIKTDIREFRKDNAEFRKEILAVHKEVHSAKVWGLIILGSGYASLIAVMAKGFGWLK